jgi:hypothetical protein
LHEQQSHIDTVVATLDTSGLDKKTTLIMGGSALALLGIRAARDIDAMVPSREFDELYRSERTPGGISVRNKPFTKRPFLETYLTYSHVGVLPIDITHPVDLDGHPSEELDQAFLRQIENFDTVAGYHYLPLDQVVAHKQGINRGKDRRDIRLINNHLAATIPNMRR